MTPDLTQQQSAKLVLLGEMGSGKSSLVLRFVKGQFFDYQESTIGAAFLTKPLLEFNVKFEIWDTAGQERGAAAAIIVYDVTSADSFTRAKKWVKELQMAGNPGMILALAGNKVDLVASGGRQVSYEEVQAYADERNAFFIETSAKDATNVDELFHEIARRLPKNDVPHQPSGIPLEQAPAQPPKQGKCC